MKVEAGRQLLRAESQLTDLKCKICDNAFMQASDLTRDVTGLAVHFDCMRRKKIKDLKLQLVIKQRLQGARPAPTSTGNEAAASLRDAPLDRPKAPLDSTNSYSSKKRNWEEHVGKEKIYPAPARPFPYVLTASNANPDIQTITISSSDEGSPPKAILETRRSLPKKEKKRRSVSRQLEPSRPQDRPLNPSGPKPVGSGLKFEELPSNRKSDTSIEPVLCHEQQRLVHTILSGRNVFYTGSAGCGKSTVLKNFVGRSKQQKVLKKTEWDKYERLVPKQVDIIAPTGRAALDINGSTFWTYAGWNPDSMKRSLEELKRIAERGKWVKKRLSATDVLVIDEISMLENHHLERLNEVMQSARGDARAFGGVQLIVTGDFCQLPPVKPFQFCYKCGFELRKSHGDTVFTCPKGHGEWQESEKWAFCSSAWDAANFAHVNLTTIHRQRDAVFVDILQKCRLGVPFSPSEEALLLQHDSQTGNAVKLFSTLNEVRSVNREAFSRLQTPTRSFRCYDDFRCSRESLRSKGQRSNYDGTLTALREHRFDPHIELKQGMVVVLLVNLDQENGLVNGSQGVIMGFETFDQAGMPRATGTDENELAYLSTGKMLTGEHAEVREANIRAFMDQAAIKVWPRVLFQNHITRTIYADCRVTELGDEAPYSLISRTQIPLVAGWAMTVHKAQGMTLNRVVVNLTKSFEEGQMYVALSRARSLEGLKVEGLGKQRGCNERVRQFLREKLSIEGA